MNSHVSKSRLSPPVLSESTSSGCETRDSPLSSKRFELQVFSGSHSRRLLAVLSGLIGSVSCLALCGEFILSAPLGKDIVVWRWQRPDLTIFAKFGQGDGSAKALATVGNKVFITHQDSRIRVWKVSRSSENMLRLVNTLPTTKDYLGKFMKQSSYVQIGRNHKRLWIEHADSISCLMVYNGLIHSGSWDKTLKVWKLSNLNCLESVKGHDDAINGLVASPALKFTQPPKSSNSLTPVTLGFLD